MKQLTASERHFFSLVHQAVYANPFSDRRSRVDIEIAGLFPGSTNQRGFGKRLHRFAGISLGSKRKAGRPSPAMTIATANC
jgi:hypothetical protein